MRLISWFSSDRGQGYPCAATCASRCFILAIAVVASGLCIPSLVVAEGIYWINAYNDSIRRVNLDGTNASIVVPLTDTIGDIANESVEIDPLNRKIYWTQLYEDLIQRANFDGTGVETIHVTAGGGQSPQGLALDLGASRMYWIANNGQLWRSDLDGGNRVQVIDFGSHGPQGLVVDPIDHRIYVSDILAGGIVRVNPDGTGLETVVTPAVARSPMNLDLDVSERRLYWANYALPLQIASVNLDGTDVRQVVAPSGFGIASLAIDADNDKVYWTNREAGTIIRADLSGANVQTIITGNSPQGIAIDSTPTTQRFAGSEFAEPAVGAHSYFPAPPAQEVGFRTTTTQNGGQNPIGAVTASGGASGNVLTHQSLAATTVFDEVSLFGWSNVELSLRLQVAATTYESGDFVRAILSNGNDSITLFDLQVNGTADDLNSLAGDGFSTFRRTIPDDWTRATLAVTSSSNSSAGAERFDFDSIVFDGSALGLEAGIDPSIAPANADDVIDFAFGTRAVHGLAHSGRHTLGYINHPGEANGNLQLWFDIAGLDSRALDILAAELTDLDEVLVAERVQGSPFLPSANLHLVLAGGATPGSSRTFVYDFGNNAFVRAIAVPEPSSLALTTFALLLLGVGRSCRTRELG
jgi:hypothetical protein